MTILAILAFAALAVWIALPAKTERAKRKIDWALADAHRQMQRAARSHRHSISWKGW